MTMEKVDPDGSPSDRIERSSGILLHITSLAGRFGIGSLGRESREFARFLRSAGQSFWQILPLGPVSPAFGFSPYSSPSTSAGNELLISLEDLLDEGWLTGPDLGQAASGDAEDFADLDRGWSWRRPLLELAAENFYRRKNPETEKQFARFRGENQSWLDDYALFMALSETSGTLHWPAWDRDIALRKPPALMAAERAHKKRTDFFRFCQFMFFRQWRKLREECGRSGVRLIGDIPFYVNLDSADAWAHPDIFQLDPDSGEPLAVAGVPPDYFSATGQRWGNPTYRWFDQKGKLSSRTCDWWVSRLLHMGRLVDLVRIDHFRGFESYWAIPAGSKTAVDGRWLKGPGYGFFRTARPHLKQVPLIAEDLGVITPEVEALRDRMNLPGMKILQFAFDRSPANPYLPHNFRTPNCIVYTGTHDNNTSNGWFYGTETNEQTKRDILDYMGITGRDEFHWQFIRLALRSTAVLSIFPMQDVLGYGGEFRMNTPGSVRGNWRWKLRPGKLDPAIAARLRHLTSLYGRLPSRTALHDASPEK